MNAVEKLLRPLLYTAAEDKAMGRLALGPVPIRWLTGDIKEWDAFRRLARRGVIEFDNETRSYVNKKGAV